jgi:hypothetical protein
MSNIETVQTQCAASGQGGIGETLQLDTRRHRLVYDER